MMRYFVLLLLFVGFIFLVACPLKIFDDTPDSDALIKAQVDTLINTQEKVADAFENALQVLDTAAAIQQVIQDFSGDPSIRSMVVMPDGISINYKSGMLGFLLIDPGEEEQQLSPPAEVMTRGEVKIPASKKAAFFLADYTNIGAEGFILAGVYETNMPKPEFSVQGFYGNDFSLDRLANLAGYGVIQFYSHGCLYSKNPDSSFLTIGEQFDKLNYNSILAFNTEFRRREVGFLTRIVNNEYRHRFWITPEFLIKFNNFTPDSTIIFNNSCYSGAGTWPDKMINGGALSYMGYDWRIGNKTSRGWMSDLIVKLCDTSLTQPYTIGTWLNEKNRVYTSKNNPHPQKGITEIVYVGYPDAGLWKQEKKNDILRIDVDLYIEDAQFRFTVDGNESFGNGAHRAFVSSREGTSTYSGNTYSTTFNKTLFFTTYSGDMTITFVGNSVNVSLTQHRSSGGCNGTYTINKTNVPFVEGQGYYQSGGEVHSGLSTSFNEQCTSTTQSLFNYNVSANDYFRVDVVYW